MGSQPVPPEVPPPRPLLMPLSVPLPLPAGTRQYDWVGGMVFKTTVILEPGNGQHDGPIPKDKNGKWVSLLLETRSLGGHGTADHPIPSGLGTLPVWHTESLYIMFSRCQAEC